jgi:hypothetical protein
MEYAYYEMQLCKPDPVPLRIDGLTVGGTTL